MIRGKQPLDNNMVTDQAGENEEGQPREKVPEISIINLEEDTNMRQVEEIIQLQKLIELLQARLGTRSNGPRKELEKGESIRREQDLD